MPGKRPAAARPSSAARDAEGALLAECRERSVALLRANTTADGVIACSPSLKATDRNYASIFGRDAAICALGMAVSGDAILERSAARSLAALARHQAPNGQIPKFIKPEIGESDFWYAGCIDATLWWLVAVEFLARHLPRSRTGEQLGAAVERALTWLSCQEHQGLFLLQQNEASDWADIMPRSGFVLYSNALWLHVKRRYGLPGRERTRRRLLQIFDPFSGAEPSHPRARLLARYVRSGSKPTGFLLSFVNFSFWGPEVDVFGNILALLYGAIPHERARDMARRLEALGIESPRPVRSVHRPIGRTSPLWRQYMERHLQNLPYQYHNGGAWPFIGGFWSLLLLRLGRPRAARAALVRCAEANQGGDWGFFEWFHGKTGEPRGMRGQSWNAATFLLAARSLEEGRALR